MRWLVAVAAIITIAAALVSHIRKPAPADPRNIGTGPGRACNLPPRTCTAHCDELVEMPLLGIGYYDYRELEESIPATSTSFIRRDLMMLVQYASAKVLCKASTWRTGHGALIGLGDASSQDGSTPGTVWGRPRHPRGSHVNGFSIDIAYYQRNTRDNELRAVCNHFDDDGNNEWRCLSQPDRLDAHRTALFVGALLEEPGVRVIGFDHLVALRVLKVFDELCRTNWIEPTACANRRKIAFESKPTGRSWYRGHHNHLHLAWN